MWAVEMIAKPPYAKLLLFMLIITIHIIIVNSSK